MKIVIDKIGAHPPHAFSPHELREFVRLLPSELLRDIRMVRLSSAIEYSASLQVASFSRLEQRLVIVSRRVSRDEAMLAVIRCLVRSNCRRPSGYGQGSAELSGPEIEQISAEMLADLQSKMPSPPHWNRVELRYVGSPVQQNGLTQRAQGDTSQQLTE